MKNILRCICKKNDYGYLTFFNIFSLSGMDSYFVKSYLRALIPSFFIALFMIFIGKPNLVPSMSMMPTIDELDFVYVNKIVYEISSPKRGDIITFDKDKYYVKRVIGAYFGESDRSFRFYPITFSSSFSSLPVLP